MVSEANGYRHVIWDWNGTLFDDVWMCVETINRSLTKRQMPAITRDQYRQVFGFPVRDYYVRLGFDFEAESFESVGTEWVVEYERRRHEVSLHAHARQVLAALRERGITQSILSAYKQETLDELVEHFDLKEFFLKVNGLDNHYATSKEAIGKAWMEELHYGPHEVLFIGDTEHDLEVATAIGADCVLIPNGNQARENLEKTGAELIGSLSELLERKFIED